MFIRRDRQGANPYTFWRVGLIFLSAGVWLGGVLAGNEIATGAAIGILVVALLLGYVGRKPPAAEEDEE